jgi:hypothetical protein
MTGNQLRDLALALPGAEERETWGHPTFRVNDKIFVGYDHEQETANVRSSKEEQAALVASDPQTFHEAPRVGRHGWLEIALDRVDDDELTELVTEAWRRAAPKRLVEEYDAGAN